MKLEEFYWIGCIEIGSVVSKTLKFTNIKNPSRTLGVDPTKVYFFSNRELCLEPENTVLAKSIKAARIQLFDKDAPLVKQIILSLAEGANRIIDKHQNYIPMKELKLSDKDKQIIELFNAGKSAQEIADEFGSTPDSINTKVCKFRKAGLITRYAKSRKQQAEPVTNHPIQEELESKESQADKNEYKRIFNSLVVLFMDIGLDLSDQKYYGLAKQFTETILKEQAQDKIHD